MSNGPCGRAARFGLWLTVTLVGCAPYPPAQAPQQAQFTKAIAPPTRLEPPAELPGSARALLRTRMAAHAQDMSDLVSAIMILRYPEIEERANAIATEARFARPQTNDATELNASLPPAFFDRERALRTQAAALAKAAHEQDAFAVADTYGHLSETCVSCHAVYRAGR